MVSPVMRLLLLLSANVALFTVINAANSVKSTMPIVHELTDENFEHDT